VWLRERGGGGGRRALTEWLRQLSERILAELPFPRGEDLRRRLHCLPPSHRQRARSIVVVVVLVPVVGTLVEVVRPESSIDVPPARARAYRPEGAAENNERDAVAAEAIVAGGGRGPPSLAKSPSRLASSPCQRRIDSLTRKLQRTPFRAAFFLPSSSPRVDKRDDRRF